MLIKDIALLIFFYQPMTQESYRSLSFMSALQSRKQQKGPRAKECISVWTQFPLTRVPSVSHNTSDISLAKPQQHSHLKLKGRLRNTFYPRQQCANLKKKKKKPGFNEWEAEHGYGEQASHQKVFPVHKLTMFSSYSSFLASQLHWIHISHTVRYKFN